MVKLTILFQQERAKDRAVVLSYDPNTAFDNMPVDALLKLW